MSPVASASRPSSCQRFSFEILHHEEVGVVLLTDVVERADVRMIQARDGARLALEPLAELAISCEVIGEDFDRDLRSRRVSAAR
jgi:hypothetical protein